MSDAPDPFSEHPELRNKISDPLQSFFRTFTTEKLEALLSARGLPVGWWYSDSEREASRAQSLEGHRDADLWVFAYGSLMWDPAFRFEEVRRAHVANHARHFILKDVYGGRGTFEAPGLMAALDVGSGCDGLAFRIARENIEEESQIIWRREKVGPAYAPVFVEATFSDRRVNALTFVADHEADLIDATLTRAQQIEFCATGKGFMGSSLDYLKNISGQFAALGIHDDEVSTLLRETEAHIAGKQTP